MALTEAGKLYYRRIQVILDELGQAHREASDVAASPQGTLRVSLPVTVGRQWITPLIPAHAAWPDWPLRAGKLVEILPGWSGRAKTSPRPKSPCSHLPTEMIG